MTPAALLAFLALERTVGGARVLERLAPAWGWLMGAWFLSGVYFCACLVASAGFRERLLARLSGFQERDEREELVTAKAARAVFLATLGCFIAAGLAGMVKINSFSYTRWRGGRVPPLERVGPYELRRGEVEKKGFLMWPSVGIPGEAVRFPELADRAEGGTQYVYASGSLFGQEVARTFFALAALQVLLFHLFARRVRA
jgi:hypothetical protein